MTFEEAVEIIIDLEGGLVDHPKDPGGLTKYGISKRSYPDEDIRRLSKERAKEIYLEDYWNKLNCDKIPFVLRLAVFDCAVNQGFSRAEKFLDEVIVSGYAQKPREAFIKYMEKRKNHYYRLKTFSVFGKGWINRLFHIYDYTFKRGL